MAMTVSGMTEAIYAEMESEYWPDTPLPPDAEAETKRYYRTISKAIIDYIKENADVLPGISVSVDPTSHKGATDGTGKIA